jgi:hypothetical protein
MAGLFRVRSYLGGVEELDTNVRFIVTPFTDTEMVWDEMVEPVETVVGAEGPATDGPATSGARFTAGATAWRIPRRPRLAGCEEASGAAGAGSATDTEREEPPERRAAERRASGTGLPLRRSLGCRERR